MYKIDELVCSTNGYKHSGLERALKGIHEAGFRLVEIAAIPGHCAHIDPDNYTEKDVLWVYSLLQKYSMRAISISGHMDLTTDDSVARFKSRIDMANDLGLKYINTGTGEAESEESINRFYKNIERIADYAEKKGVIVALETHGGLTGSSSECIKTLANVKSDNIRINYDTANVIYYRGVAPEEDIASISKSIAHVHLKDKCGGKGIYDFPPIGDGEINFTKVFKTLWDVGYQGPISLEVELQWGATAEQEDEALKRSYEYLLKILR